MMPPLEEIFGRYISWKIDEQTWVINFMEGSENMYLLEGEKKALLIDTGFGVGNLRKYVETLTDKPIEVVNTHFHPDHAAGNGEFPKVYVSHNWKADEAAVYSSGAVPFDISKLPYPNYEKIGLHDGDVIDLGKRLIEVFEAKPAHCESSLFFLDRGHRMFFCGDDLEAGQVNLFDNSYNPEVVFDVEERLANFKANTEKIKALSKEFDLLFPNHNGAPISKTYIDHFVELVDAIYAGTAVIEEQLNHRFLERDPQAQKLCRVRWKDVSIFTYKEGVKRIFGGKK
ncbi:MAG: MBL fold metallo-hydrolase [Lachnospiraceae bacterium]|nr:MBL fold metallo-hydrolase [Lachnospiraceae bacterium]